MEKPKMRWSDFVGRRRMKNNIQEWLKEKRIRSKKELQEWCNRSEVEMPSDLDLKEMFPKKSKKVESVVSVGVVVPLDSSSVVEESVSEEAPKKPGRKKKTDVGTEE